MSAVPLTVTRLPGRLLPPPLPSGPLPLPLSGGFQPSTSTSNSPSPAPAGAAAPDIAEVRVSRWLHYDQHGRTDTVTGSADEEARR
ncbi:hypothetical protein OHA98_39880 [Streptomyces sp. NBC_00654]|uniref:hypothetical protein n=1 Tax=Streptomyces sp. NBC_00654 TaxID=2975799 RepID=UPI00224C8D52|nr:hypothetical protein [Streptomyces sp. NBC_00654]MCX4970803.1 hypothetical protein [Streptomyces sp. NBC_00654]